MEKVENFRQIGGKGIANEDNKKIKDGLLYRSAKPDYATESDKEYLINQLSLKSIIDLRGVSEYKKREMQPFKDTFTTIFMKDGLAKEESRPTTAPIGYMYVIDKVGWKHAWDNVANNVNIFLRAWSLVLMAIDYIFGSKLTIQFFADRVINKVTLWEHYMDILESSKPEIAMVLRLVSDPLNLPCLIHCRTGKNRTGYISALILACIGIEDDIIIMDYALTEEVIKPHMDNIIKYIRDKYGADERFAHADVDTMRLLLKEIRNRYGSVQNYVSSTGFTEQEQRKLRETLLE